MYRTTWVAIGLASLLMGCGQQANDLRLSLALNEWRQECFGNDTYTCRNKTVDFNILVLTLTDFKSESAKEEVTRLFGDKGWDLYKEVVDDFIKEGEDKLNEMRPNLFARWFFGDDRPPSPSGRMLDFSPADMDSAQKEIQRLFVARALKQGLKPNAQVLKDYASTTSGGAAEPPKAVEAAKPEVPAPVTAPPPQQPLPAISGDLGSAVTAYAKSVATDGGTEYPEGRQMVQLDLNSDGEPDAVVVFTIEGTGGAQNGYQTLAGFVHEDDGWKVLPGAVVVEGSVQKLTVDGPNTVLVQALTPGPDDPDCCPSTQTPQRYLWSGESFVSLPPKSGS